MLNISAGQGFRPAISVGVLTKASEYRCPSFVPGMSYKKHHTSICEGKLEQMLMANGNSSVLYPLVIVEVNDIEQ